MRAQIDKRRSGERLTAECDAEIEAKLFADRGEVFEQSLGIRFDQSRVRSGCGTVVDPAAEKAYVAVRLDPVGGGAQSAPVGACPTPCRSERRGTDLCQFGDRCILALKFGEVLEQLAAIVEIGWR